MLLIGVDYINTEVLKKEETNLRCLIHCKTGETFVCSKDLYNKISLEHTKYKFCIREIIQDNVIPVYREILRYKV